MTASSSIQSATRTIISVDPGLSITGYGIVQVDSRGRLTMLEGGIVRTKSDDPLQTRLETIHREIADVISQFKPQEMAIEDLHARYRNLKTAIIMGHARGVAVLAAGQAGIAVFNYQPTRVKSVVTGTGRADKEQMLKAVKIRLRLEQDLKQQDVADALGIAICHAQTTEGSNIAQILELNRAR